MTVGQLARHTGVSIKALREYERLGLIYSLGRSESNYRLFDDSALWCVQVVRGLRALGLTVKEIHEIATIYLTRPLEPIGPHWGQKLNRALSRTETKMAELQALRQRILDFQATHASALSGQTDLDPFGADPRRTKTKDPA